MYHEWGRREMRTGYWCENQNERNHCGWVDNIKIYLRDIGWGDKDWIDLTQDRD
jgi:hypothetical protein